TAGLSNSSIGVLVGTFSSAFVLGVLMTNQIHKWAHAPHRAPAAVRFLQRAGIILPPGHHLRHHRNAHDRAFCITTGWLNPVMDRGRFYDVLTVLAVRLLPRTWHPIRVQPVPAATWGFRNLFPHRSVESALDDVSQVG